MFMEIADLSPPTPLFFFADTFGDLRCITTIGADLHWHIYIGDKNILLWF